MWVLGGPSKSCGVGRSVCSAQHSRFGCQEFKIHQDLLQKSEQSGLQCFFSVQSRMASARSFNMFPSMLHIRLIN